MWKHENGSSDFRATTGSLILLFWEGEHILGNHRLIIYPWALYIVYIEHIVAWTLDNPKIKVEINSIILPTIDNDDSKLNISAENLIDPS